MKNKFDIWGSTIHKDYKPGYRDSTKSEKNCHARAEEVFSQCGDRQAITAWKKNMDCTATKAGAAYTGALSKTRGVTSKAHTAIALDQQGATTTVTTLMGSPHYGATPRTRGKDGNTVMLQSAGAA